MIAFSYSFCSSTRSAHNHAQSMDGSHLPNMAALLQRLTRLEVVFLEWHFVGVLGKTRWNDIVVTVATSGTSLWTVSIHVATHTAISTVIPSNTHQTWTWSVNNVCCQWQNPSDNNLQEMMYIHKFSWWVLLVGFGRSIKDLQYALRIKTQAVVLITVWFFLFYLFVLPPFWQFVLT